MLIDSCTPPRMLLQKFNKRRNPSHIFVVVSWDICGIFIPLLNQQSDALRINCGFAKCLFIDFTNRAAHAFPINIFFLYKIFTAWITNEKCMRYIPTMSVIPQLVHIQLLTLLSGGLSCRQVLSIMVILGFMLNYMLRVNLTIAIVAMVVSSNSSGDHHTSNDSLYLTEHSIVSIDNETREAINGSHHEYTSAAATPIVTVQDKRVIAYLPFSLFHARDRPPSSAGEWYIMYSRMCVQSYLNTNLHLYRTRMWRLFVILHELHTLNIPYYFWQ